MTEGRKRRKKGEGRKEGEGRREGEGRKEGRKEVRKEGGRKEGMRPETRGFDPIIPRTCTPC